MIKVQDETPKIYYNESRDFQFIGRLYDVVLNSVKTNCDLLYNLPISDNVNTQMLDLMSTTLGFKIRHNYNTKQLVSACSIFPTILKNKGNIQAIQLIGDALLHAEGITEDFGYEISDDNTSIDIFIPSTLSDINLFKDLLSYVMPAGMNVNIIRATRIYQAANKIQTNVPVKHVIDSKFVEKPNKIGSINSISVIRGTRVDNSDGE